MTIITEYPSVFMGLCLMAGVVYAGALYFRDRFNRTYGSRLATLLGFMRFILVSFLAFFLMKPLIKTVDRTVAKPIVVIAQDNSQSLVVGQDSAAFLSKYAQQLKQFTEQFGDDYEIRTYRFGASVEEGIDSLRFDQKLTDFSGLLDEITNKYSGRNLGAIIVASDGLYNKGSNPVYAYQKLNVPVYTIALGDTTVHKDVLIAEVAANRLAYLGNRFPIQITVEGRKAAGETSNLTVTHGGQTIYTENISFTGDRFNKTISLTADANEIGLQRYSIHLSSVSDEITLANNHRDVFIDVLDSRQKVLILAQSPHPDLNAMRDAIAANESYKVEVKLASDFNGNVGEYSLAIFHQLPALGGNGTSIIRNALEGKVPALFVWGAQTDFRGFNELKTGYALDFYRNSNTDVSGQLAEGFSLFTLSEPTQNMLKMMPPLAVPFGDYAFAPGVNAFINQQVGQIKTQKPLISFNRYGEDNKVGLIAGEGIWRWRLTSFAQMESHDAFNELITKTVQYLASKEDRSLFRVNGDNDIMENEPVIFDAELYNPSYEAITDREVKMRIKNEAGDEFNYTFSPNGTRYRLVVGQMPVGNYTYESTVMTDQGALTERGEFSVSPLQLEYVNTVADHRLLYQFAKDNGGEMVYPDQMNSIIDMIRNKKEIVSISYDNKSLNDLINYKWILFFLIALLGGEWLLRKRAGTY